MAYSSVPVPAGTGTLAAGVASPTGTGTPPARREGGYFGRFGAIMAVHTPRSMSTSSRLSALRVSRCFMRGISFLGCAGSRKPTATSACSQCASSAWTAAPSAGAAPGLACWADEAGSSDWPVPASRA